MLLGPFEAIAWWFKHAMPKFPLQASTYNKFLFRSNESKAYPLIMGNKVVEAYCHMTVASSENERCGNGAWTLVMKTDGKKVPPAADSCTNLIK